MRINSISLRNYKKYEELDQEFSPGINVIKGPNESGKSTLVDAISTILFERAKSRKEFIKNLATWGQQSLPTGRMDLEKEGKHYRILKDINGKKQSVSLIEEGKVKGSWTDESNVDNIIEKLVGIGNKDLFESVSCVKQNEMNFSKNKNILAKSLQQVVTGVQTDSTALDALDKFDKKIGDMNKGRERLAKYPGIIKELEDEITELDNQIIEIRETVTETESAKEDLIETEARLQKLEEEVKMAEKLLELNKNYREITNKKDDLQGKLKELSIKIEIIKERQGNIDDLSRKISARSNISNAIQEGLDLQIQRINQAIEIQKKYRSQIQTQESQALPSPKLIEQRKSRALPSITVALIGVVVGILLFFIQPFLGIIVVLGMLSLSALIYFLKRERAPVDVEKASITIPPPAMDFDREINSLEHQSNNLLVKYGFSSINEMIRELSEYNRLIKRRDELNAEIRGALSGKTLEEINERKIEIAGEIAIESQKIPPGTKEKILSPKEYSDLEMKTKADQETLENLRNHQRDLQAQLKSAGAGKEDLYSLEEQKVELNEHLDREMERLEVLETAKGWLEIAKERTMQPAASLLEKELGKTIAKITSNKYNRISVDKDNLDISIIDDEREISIEDLSIGTIDQIYISARLGLHKIITGDKNPPLIFDEPFVNFDSQRHENIKRMLITISKENQILIFSHLDEYDEIADKVIELS